MPQSEKILDIVMEEGPRVPPVPPSPPHPNPLSQEVLFSCWILGRSWDGKRGIRNHSAHILLGMESSQYLNNHYAILLNMSQGQCVDTLSYKYMDRKPRPKVILLIAEFKKKLRQLHKHFTKTHKNQRKMQVEKPFHLKMRHLKTCWNICV